MLRRRERYIVPLFVFFLALSFVSNVHSKGYRNFLLLNPDDCAPLGKNVVMQLPAEWHKYAKFVKICELKEKKARVAKVSIVSIWADDYYDARPPGAMWENFPLPLIVDHDYRQLGQLPELYPTHQESELNLYYGKWQSGMPTEIRIDVRNPAVGGDYYYAPLIWNKTTGRYEMKSKEITHGVR